MVVPLTGHAAQLLRMQHWECSTAQAMPVKAANAGLSTGGRVHGCMDWWMGGFGANGHMGGHMGGHVGEHMGAWINEWVIIYGPVDRFMDEWMD